MARNLNAPEHWAAWIKACQKDPGNPIEARGSLGMVTGQDFRALHAVAACWRLALAADTRGTEAGMAALAALLNGMQEACWPFARELAAQQGEWSHRLSLWPRVLARRATKALAWRGSVGDLVTDILGLALSREQEQEFLLELATRINARDMYALRSRDQSQLEVAEGEGLGGQR